MKQCINCNERKEDKYFSPVRNQCNSCIYQMQKARGVKNYEVTVTEKVCLCCNVLKPVSGFNRNPRHKTGLTIYCNDCRSIKNAKRYQKNTELIKAQTIEYYRRNKSKVTKRNLEYQKQKVKTDPFYNLSRRLRNRLWYALKNTTWKKNTNFSEYIGCDRDTLVSHIESQFVEGMTWDNRSEWHVDHKIPLISAKSEEELYKLCHYTNLCPMWGADNLSKGGKY